jgi:hypothetical protein
VAPRMIRTSESGHEREQGRFTCGKKCHTCEIPASGRPGAGDVTRPRGYTSPARRNGAIFQPCRAPHRTISLRWCRLADSQFES